MGSDDQIIKLLATFGLTGNESRIYLSLLSNNPATGYEISRMAGVPRSAVYAVLGRLEELNLVNGTGRKPRHFTPIPPGSLIDHLGQKTESDLADLTQAFSSLESGNHDVDFWQIKGYDKCPRKPLTVRNASIGSYINLFSEPGKGSPQVAFLTSEEAAYTTGNELCVTGGWML